MSYTGRRPEPNIVRPKANPVEPSQVAIANNESGLSGEALRIAAASGNNPAATRDYVASMGYGTGGGSYVATNTGGNKTATGGSSSGALKQESTLLPVRVTLENAGLDPSKIGWANGQVTYGGHAFKPAENRNGTTYATRSEIDGFIKGIQNANGNLGIRDTFVSLGLNPNKIGWDNGYVTYGGVRFEPKINANGTTYAPAQEVYRFADDALRTQGDGLVKVSEYMPANGLYDVGWNDATKDVLIGGMRIPYAYVDESGRAWAKASDLEEAYNRLGKARGILSPAEQFNEWLKYNSELQAALDEIRERDFSYNPESDPAYQAYKKMYTREGERAYEDMLARATARTGGNMSSMARAQAEQQRAYYMQKLSDAIPQLYQLAYERYIADQNRDISVLSQKSGLYQDRYNNAMNTNGIAWNRWNEQQDAKTQREYDDMELRVANSNANATIAENEFNISSMYDVPLSAEAIRRYGVAPNSDGTYPTANEIVIRRQNELWEGYEKGIYDYQQAAELQTYIDKMAIDLGADKMLAAYKQSIKKGTTKTGTAGSEDWSL